MTPPPPEHDETPEQRDQRRRTEPARERLARLEERADTHDSDLRDLRRAHERLEARLWLLVTSAAGVGSAGGAAAATWFVGG